MLENLLKVIGRERLSDSELISQAGVYDDEAVSQQGWFQAEDYLKKAKKIYSRLQEGRSETLLEHARYAEYLTFPRINNFELEAQFEYSRRIYQNEKSIDDLYNLALHAEERAFGFRPDIHQIQFLEYARTIFLKSNNKEDVKRLAQKATKQAVSFGTPIAESRFLEFAIESYRKIGETEIADALKAREKAVGCYLKNCLLQGIEPQYTVR